VFGLFVTMKKWILYLSGVISLALSLSACATFLAPPSPTPEPTATTIPSPTAPPPTVETKEGVVNQVAWSPDGALLAVAGSEGVYLYTVETLQKLSTLETGAASLAFSPLDGGQTLATAQDETIQLWDVS